MAGKATPERFTFLREERLKSRKLIETLFSQRAYVQHPVLRIYYIHQPTDCAFPAQFAFSASKKIYSSAVDRNKVKRLLREAVRLEKPFFYEQLGHRNSTVLLLLSYQHRTILPFSEIRQVVRDLLLKIASLPVEQGTTA